MEVPNNDILAIDLDDIKVIGELVMNVKNKNDSNGGRGGRGVGRGAGRSGSNSNDSSNNSTSKFIGGKRKFNAIVPAAVVNSNNSISYNDVVATNRGQSIPYRQEELNSSSPIMLLVSNALAMPTQTPPNFLIGDPSGSQEQFSQQDKEILDDCASILDNDNEDNITIANSSTQLADNDISSLSRSRIGSQSNSASSFVLTPLNQNQQDISQYSDVSVSNRGNINPMRSEVDEILGTTTRTSAVWDHCSVRYTNCAKTKIELYCTHCSWTNEYRKSTPTHKGSGTGNASTHMRTRDYKVCPFFAARNNSTADDDESSGAITTHNDSNSGKGSMVQTLLYQNRSNNNSLSCKNTSTNVSISQIRCSIGEFMCEDEKPFAVVEGDGFCNMIQKLRPGTALLSSRTYANDVYNVMYPSHVDSVRAIIQQAMREGALFSLTTDIWTCGVQKRG